MQISLVFTTYNWEAALEACLRSAMAQTYPPDEIIVADDGSGPPTLQVIDRLRAGSPVRLVHVWQEDQGFRKAAVLNKAVARSRGEYLLLLDGDMVLERHFVEDHRSAARDGYFVHGGRVLLGPDATAGLLGREPPDLRERSEPTAVYHPATIAMGSRQGRPIRFLSPGIRNRKNAIRSGWLSRVASRRAATARSASGGLLGIWRADLLRVNGFDERFVGWGWEDTEFVVRLLHSGIRRLELRHLALAYHLHHAGNGRDGESRNRSLFEETARSGRMWCEQGINRYLDEAATPADAPPRARAA